MRALSGPGGTLSWLLAKFGPDIADDPQRCRGFLLDAMPHDQLHVDVLVNAVDAGVAAELRDSAIDQEVLVPELVERMQAGRGMPVGHARFAVEAWARALSPIELVSYALGAMVSTERDQIDYDPGQCRAWLQEAVPDGRTETSALIDALADAADVGIPGELQVPSPSGKELPNYVGSPANPPAVIMSKLGRVLADDRGLSDDLARWAVEAWAGAVGGPGPGANGIPTLSWLPCSRCGTLREPDMAARCWWCHHTPRDDPEFTSDSLSRSAMADAQLEFPPPEGTVQMHLNSPFRLWTPLGWGVKEELTIQDHEGLARVVVSREPVEGAIDSRQYALYKGVQLAEERTGYRELRFGRAIVFGDRDGYVRELEWWPSGGGGRLREIQLYFAQGVEGATATASAAVRDFASVEATIRSVLGGVTFRASRSF